MSMQGAKVVLFDDRGITQPSDSDEPGISRPGVQLAPLTDLRASFLVRTGVYTLKERLESMGCVVVGVRVPSALAALTRTAVHCAVNEPSGIGKDDRVWMLDGRCVLPGVSLERCAEVSQTHADQLLLEGVLPDAPVTNVGSGGALNQPWDVVRYRDDAIAFDLPMAAAAVTGSALPPHCHADDANRVHVDAGSRVGPFVVFDTGKGDVVVAEGASIGAHAVIEGPAFIGAGSSVAAHAHVRPNTVVGPVCKVNGEIGGVIFQGYANKGHAGYLGDSWVGEWVNLGAGTDCSNLLNTYGEVKARAPGKTATPGLDRASTGLHFFGAVMGDHSKTAIGTRIMTGSVWGTATMCALGGLPPTHTRAFTWLTDRAPDGSERWGFEKFMETARAMMARRGIEPIGPYVERLREIAR